MTRIGASQVFFNIVAQFNAEKLIKDYRSVNTVMKAVSLDTFEAILKPIEGLGQAINQVTDELMPLQEAMGLASVEFEKFFGMVPEMETMRDSIISLGEAYNITAVEALNAGSRAAQVANLLGRGNVMTLMELAFTLAEISDLNAEEAQRGIIQLHQQTGMLFGDMNKKTFERLTLQEQQNVLVTQGAKALDALNTIANRSVALEGDLVRVMGTFAAQGELVGDSFEFMAAASAVLLEAGEEQGTAGRALRMMYARLGGDISGARSEIEALGYEMMKGPAGNRSMKNMQEVLTELSEKGWKNLTGQQKQNIAQTISGNRHYVRFIKLMENYDRTIQLTTDGYHGFDSALGQANRALESQVNLLKGAQNETETLKGKIGEGLTPFMKGQVEVTNDYLRVTEVLTDSLGGLGEIMGRMKGTAQVMGAFIKVGLATQSLGIGFEMFTSVQRQLNGILVANEHLHSKSANWLDHGVKASMTQRDLLLGMQFLQQKINMHGENRRWHEKLVNVLLEEQKAIVTDLVLLENEQEVLLDKQTVMHQRVLAAKRLETVEATRQNSIYDRRAARIEYELTFESDMLERVEALYSEKSATQDAMMRQYLADLQTAANYTDDELTHIRNRHELLKEEHTLMQTLKADNENRYRAGGGNYDGQKGGPNSGMVSSLQMSPQDRKVLGDRMAIYGNEASNKFYNAMVAGGRGKGAGRKGFGEEGGEKMMKGAMTRFNKSNYDNTDALAHFTDAAAAHTLQVKLMSGATAEYTGPESKLLQNMMKDNQGRIIQTTKALETHASMTLDQREGINRLNEVSNEKLQIDRRIAENDLSMLNLDMQDIALMEKIAPLMALINDEKTEEVVKTEALIALSQQLGVEVDQLTEANMRYIQKGKQDMKFTTDRTMAHRQFGFALQNSIGMLSGMAGGTLGASLSLGFMISNLTRSGSMAISAAADMIKLQYAQTKASFAAKEHTGTLKFLRWEINATTYAAGSAAVALGMMVAPFLLIGGALYMFQKNSEDAAKAMEDLNEEMMTFESIVNTLAADKKILEDDFLAQAIGIDNSETSAMLKNVDLIDTALTKLREGQGKYSDTQNTQIENAIDYLTLVKSVHNDGTSMNLGASESAWAGARGEFNAFDVFIQRTGSQLEAGQELFDNINNYGLEFVDTTHALSTMTSADNVQDGQLNQMANLNQLIAIQQAGVKLTEEQIDLAAEYFDDDEIIRYLEAANQLVLTQEIRNDLQGRLNDELEDTNNLMEIGVSDIKNLSDEIYNFAGAREELFFGGKYGNVTGSLYRQVVNQGVGTLYHKNEVIMTTNFHGFFNEQEAADRITRIVTDVLAAQ